MVSQWHPATMNEHAKGSLMVMVLLRVFVPLASVACVQAFVPSQTQNHQIQITTNHAALFMKKRRKLSMKERRKQRSKRQPAVNVNRRVLDDLPPVDSWEKTQPTAAAAAPMESAKASSLVQSQRKSVDCLTFIRKRIEERFPITDAARSLVEQGYFVHDNFLSSDEDEVFGDDLLSEMFGESSNMLTSDNLERDITRLGDGEFIGNIVGGEKYVDCPRLTEYVVSLTRHLPPMLNKEMEALGAGSISHLSSTASQGAIRLYDRRTRLGAETLLMKPETGDDYQDRPFGVICGNPENNDVRRLTAMLFLSSKDWNTACGGGVTVENCEKLNAVRDRVILLRSDTCSIRQEPWVGDGGKGLEQASCVTVHFVRDMRGG